VLHPLLRLGYFFVAAPVTAICGGLLDGPWARPRSTVTAASAARSVVPRQSSSCQGRALEEGKGGSTTAAGGGGLDAAQGDDGED